MTHGDTIDLVILVADADAEWTVRTLIEKRRHALGIRPVRAKVVRHPHRDAGVRSHGHEFLRQYVGKADYALVMLDREGSGHEHRSPGEIESDIEARLVQNGWTPEHVAAVVLDPELEAWVWSPSPHVAEVIGLESDELQAILEQVSLNALNKPERPKEVLEKALRQSRRPFSARIFQELAESVSLRHCQDRAFGKFRSTLQRWFPDVSGSGGGSQWLSNKPPCAC